MSFQYGGESIPPAAAEGAQSTQPKLGPGDVIGSYELVALLGSGAMGEVYSARHARLGRNVAIKVLKPEHSGNTSLVQRFFQEARAVNQINHRHIVEVYDFVEELAAEGTGRVYCVMELLTGQDLGHLLHDEKLPVVRVASIGRQICEALGAAHDVGVVHRDVKPDNIFIARRPGEPEFVKVLDFGVAKLVNAPMDRSISTTTEGAMVGTPKYMSPEQAASLDVDQRTDIYALGCVMYEMLAGRPPFFGKPFGPLIADILTQPPPPLPPTALDGEPIPEPLAALVLKCLEKKPQARPQSMGDVAAVLAAVAAGAPLTAVRARSRMPWMLAAALVLLAGVAVAFALRSRSRPDAPAPAVATPAPKPAPLSPAPAPTVSLQITSSPPGATVIRSDTGAALGTTPFAVTLPRGGGQLDVRTEREGFQSARGTLSLERDGVLDLRLVPVATKARSRSTPSAAPKKSVGDDVLDPYAQ
jgi:serine/threonine protein kinase